MATTTNSTTTKTAENLSWSAVSCDVVIGVRAGIPGLSLRRPIFLAMQSSNLRLLVSRTRPGPAIGGRHWSRRRAGHDDAPQGPRDPPATGWQALATGICKSHLQSQCGQAPGDVHRHGATVRTAGLDGVIGASEGP
jgi:hypothetical protein